MVVPQSLEASKICEFDYSICTLVTDRTEYDEMVISFIDSGFSAERCEYLYADNTKSNTLDAYAAINRFLHEARGRYIIICHQDILLLDTKLQLERCVEQVTILDPNWAVLSNAGAVGPNYFSMLISYPGDKIIRKGHPPEKLSSVDENFILVKSSANLALSADLTGFHMYGTDLCLIADILGYSAYSIPFSLLHKSTGNASEDFWLSKENFKNKYNRKLSGRWIQTTITHFYTGGSFIERLLKGNLLVLMVIKSLNSLKKRGRVQ